MELMHVYSRHIPKKLICSCLLTGAFFCHKLNTEQVEQDVVTACMRFEHDNLGVNLLFGVKFISTGKAFLLCLYIISQIHFVFYVKRNDSYNIYKLKSQVGKGQNNRNTVHFCRFIEYIYQSCQISIYLKSDCYHYFKKKFIIYFIRYLYDYFLLYN